MYKTYHYKQEDKATMALPQVSSSCPAHIPLCFSPFTDFKTSASLNRIKKENFVLKSEVHLELEQCTAARMFTTPESDVSEDCSSQIPDDIPCIPWTSLTDVKTLDQGSFGHTSTASLLHDGRSLPVVIKQLQKPSLKDLVNEAKVLQDVNTAGGAPLLYGISQVKQENTFVLVMSFCPGQTLYQYLENRSVTEYIRLFIKTCKAVDEFHGRGYAHRDLHFNNIIVEETVSDIIVHLIDVGLAKPLTGKLHEDSSVKYDYDWLLSLARIITNYLGHSLKYSRFKTAVKSAAGIKLLMKLSEDELTSTTDNQVQQYLHRSARAPHPRASSNV